MGVMSVPEFRAGVDVSEHLAMYNPYCIKNTRLVPMLVNNKEIGSFIWGADLDPLKVY